MIVEVAQMKTTYGNSGVIKCTKECDMMVFGALSMALEKLNRLVCKDPNGKLNPISATRLFTTIKELDLPSLHRLDNGTKEPPEEPPKWPAAKKRKTKSPIYKCAPKDQLVKAVTKIMDSEKGLDLAEYCRAST